MATAIRKVSELDPSCAAVLIETGAITAAVAALFIRSDKVMVTTRIRISAITGRPWAIVSSSDLAIRSAAPVDSIAKATGIRAPSSTMTGQSTAS